MSQSTSDPAVLEFRDATLPGEAPHWMALREVRCSLAPGQCALVRTLHRRLGLPLAPAAVGLTLAQSGEVRFQGQSWSDRDPAAQARRRGLIGRVFEGWGWVSNLSVVENVVLAQRHHTRRTDAELEQQADILAKRFQLHQTPRGRPANLSADILQRSQWVRALLGQPRLLLLEHPGEDVELDALDNLVDEVAAARQRGAAVLWITGDHRLVTHPRLCPTARYEIDHALWRQVSEPTP